MNSVSPGTAGNCCARHRSLARSIRSREEATNSTRYSAAWARAHRRATGCGLRPRRVARRCRRAPGSRADLRPIRCGRCSSPPALCTPRVPRAQAVLRASRPAAARYQRTASAKAPAPAILCRRRPAITEIDFIQFDMRQRGGGGVGKGGIALLLSVRQCDPALDAMDVRTLRPGLQGRPFRVYDAPAGAHPIDIAGPDFLHGSQAIAVREGTRK